jgi:glycosyltransferase involved in cell wall biosynthesis
MLKDLEKRIAKLNLKNIVIWSYLPTFVEAYNAIPAKLRVFDAVDNWLEHSAYNKIKDRLKLNYDIIKHKSDIIFTTSQEMVNYFDKEKGVYYIPNGVQWQMYKNPPKIVSRDIASLPRPIIGYVGILQQDRIDLELIHYIATKNPKKTFVFVGPVWPNFRKKLMSRLGGIPNIHFLGRKHYWEIPAYDSQFDVAIIPHLLNEFGKHTSLLKMMEYLAAGKPVVSTPTSGTDAFKKIVKLAATPEQFNKAIISALSKDSLEAYKQRQEVAWHYSWTEQVNTMLEKVILKI